jgi:hypothetical protein
VYEHARKRFLVIKSIALHRTPSNKKPICEMARGNQRDKAREANLKKQAAQVSAPRLNPPDASEFSRFGSQGLPDANRKRVTA